MRLVKQSQRCKTLSGFLRALTRSTSWNMLHHGRRCVLTGSVRVVPSTTPDVQPRRHRKRQAASCAAGMRPAAGMRHRQSSSACHALSQKAQLQQRLRDARPPKYKDEELESARRRIDSETQTLLDSGKLAWEDNPEGINVTVAELWSGQWLSMVEDWYEFFRNRNYMNIVDKKQYEREAIGKACLRKARMRKSTALRDPDLATWLPEAARWRPTPRPPLPSYLPTEEAPPEVKQPTHPELGWGAWDFRAWQEKAKQRAHDQADWEADSAEVGRFQYLNVSRYNDARLMPEDGSIPRVWTHSDIMDLITLGGRNVHPDYLVGKPGIRVQKPRVKCDYFEEGITYPEDLEDELIATGHMQPPEEAPLVAGQEVAFGDMLDAELEDDADVEAGDKEEEEGGDEEEGGGVGEEEEDEEGGAGGGAGGRDIKPAADDDEGEDTPGAFDEPDDF